MKKLILLSVFGTLAIFSCKKKANDPSTLVTPSFPTITLTGSQFYSIQVGGTLPSISATAYDSFYNETDNVLIDQSTLDNTTPGLYQVSLSATNKYGFIGYNAVYIGVTSASASLNLAGSYIRLATPGRVAHVTKLGTGLFMTDNVGGVDITDPTTGAAIPAVFVVTSDSTIDFGSQMTAAGTLTASQQGLTLVPGDTTLSYALALTGFGTQLRTFVKQ